MARYKANLEIFARHVKEAGGAPVCIVAVFSNLCRYRFDTYKYLLTPITCRNLDPRTNKVILELTVQYEGMISVTEAHKINRRT